MAGENGQLDARDEHLAQGEAGLYFAEALALKLIEQGLLDADEVVDAARTAMLAKKQAVQDGQSPRISRRSVSLLKQLINSVSAAGRLPPVKS